MTRFARTPRSNRGRSASRASAVLAAAGLLGLTPPGVASADDLRPAPEATPANAAAPDSDADLLARLAAPDYATREAATRDLLLDATRTADDLRDLWRRTDSLEARHRLVGVLRHRFLEEQAAAMFPGRGLGAIGVSHRTLDESSDPPLGAQVVATLPGFPGHAHLRAGDVITAVDGRPLRGGEGVEVLSQRVQQLQQGATIGLTVWRDGRFLEVAFELGSLTALQAVYSPRGTGEPFASRLAAMEAALWASADDTPGGE